MKFRVFFLSCSFFLPLFEIVHAGFFPFAGWGLKKFEARFKYRNGMLMTYSIRYGDIRHINNIGPILYGISHIQYLKI